VAAGSARIDSWKIAYHFHFRFLPPAAHTGTARVMGTRRDMVAGGRTQLTAGSSWQVETRETEAFSRGKGEGRDIARAERGQFGRNGPSVLLKRKSVPLWLFSKPLAPSQCPAAFLSKQSLFSVIIMWKDMCAGALATRHYFISCLIALYKPMYLNSCGHWIYTYNCTAEQTETPLWIVLLPFLTITSSATQ